MEQDKINPLGELAGIISGAPKEIEAEVEGTENNWTAAFGSIVFQLETRLLVAKSFLSKHKYEDFSQGLEELKIDLVEAKDKEESGELKKKDQKDLLEKIEALGKLI